MDILEEPPQALHPMEGRASELEDGCQREADQSSVTSLLKECGL